MQTTLDRVADRSSVVLDLFSVLAPSCDLPSLRALLGPGRVSLQSVESAIQDRAVQFDGAMRADAVDGLGFILGIVVSSAAGTSIVKRHEQSLTVLLNDGVAPFDLSRWREDEQPTHFHRWLNQRLVTIGSELLADVRSVRRALVTLRVEHEETLERFALLETASQFATPRVIEKLHLGPTDARLELGAAEGGGDIARLRQTLPIQALGLSGIEIFTDGSVKTAQGTLTIDLLLGSRRQPVHRWMTAAGRLVVGRNTFLLERALVSRERDPILEIGWSGSTPLNLQLSHPNPIPTFCAAIAGSHRSHAPLAVRVFGAVPGSRVTSAKPQAAGSGESQQAVGADVEPITFALGSNELETVQLLHPTSLDVLWNVVEFRGGNLDVLVHPLPGQPTVAIIRGLNVRGLKHLSALVLLDNKDAKPVEFALGAVRSRTSHVNPDALPSRWTRAEAQVYTEVEGTIDLDGADSFDLFLATRMHDGGDPDNAWAFFKRIEVTV